MHHDKTSVLFLLSTIAALTCACMQQREQDLREKARPGPPSQGRFHHRPAAPISVTDASSLLPKLSAKTVTAPFLTPQQRVVTRYCFENGSLSDRGEALADSLRGQWAQVSIQRLPDRIIIRATQGPYALRASVTASTDLQCAGDHAALAAISVFKPLAGGGFGPARRRG